VSHIGLPPLVGFLLAGFVLNAAGAEGGNFLRITADLGVTLMLFTIGLKLRKTLVSISFLTSILRPEKVLLKT
jgi:predicted Kef-type K+ transport protein